jgi:cysteine-rich repeat protein
MTEQAQAFLQEYGLIFGVQDPAQELRLIDIFTDAIGAHHIIYQQQYQGVPVFAGELRLHFNSGGELLAANGVFIPDLTLDPIPRISAQTAREYALLHIGQQNAAQRQASPAHLDAEPASLYLFRANLARGLPGPNHLVYEVLVSNDQDVREFVYIDAYTGVVVDQISGLYPAIQRRVYKSTTFLDPTALVWREGDPLPYNDSDPSVQTHINKLIEYSEDTYNFFAGLSGGVFLSWDGDDAIMNSVYDHLAIGCPNASWNGASTNYCLDVITDDLVAHEWTHGYTQSTHDLIYQWQPGALNEAYSDIWGETIDLVNHEPPDSPDARRTDNACSIFGNADGVDHSKRWLLLEDSRGFGQALRDMWNPGCFGDPGKVSDANYFCSAGDNGGVHANSGIANHAYALLVDGGVYNGQTVNGIGLTRAANIYWRTQTIYQTQTSDYADHADALEQACTDLIGAQLYALDTADPAPTNAVETVSAADCAEVSKVIAAVELRAEPVKCNFPGNLQPNAPPLCLTQGPLVSLLSQDWETGIGVWGVGTRAVVSEATFSTADWAVVTSLPDSRPGAAAFVANEKFGNNVTDIETGVLYLESPPIALPVEALAPRVAFDHWFATQPGRDGGVLSIRVNDGPWQLMPKEVFEFNPYTGVVFSGGVGAYTDSTAPIPAFQGTDYATFDTGSWGQSQVDLLGVAGPGDTVQFRFEMILDAKEGVHGWYVDEVQVFYCQSCGNGQVDDGEQCDDGNTTDGDGCSALCQVEPAWFCKDPVAALASRNVVADSSFESSSLTSIWQGASTSFGSPFCGPPTCLHPAYDGQWMARFGGAAPKGLPPLGAYERSIISQTIIIPPGVATLAFALSAPNCDNAEDYLEVLIDDRQIFRMDGASALCGVATYTVQSAALAQYADGREHRLVFNSEARSTNGGFSTFLVDSVTVLAGGREGAASLCTSLQSSYCSLPYLAIPDADVAGVSSTIMITPQFSSSSPSSAWLADLDVYVQTQHTWLGDLSFRLAHEESGRTVTLLDRPGSSGPGAFGCSGNDMDVLFDDEGSVAAEVDCDIKRTPALRGNRRPGPEAGTPGVPNGDGDAVLQTFKGERLAGHWTLTAIDNAVDETGTLVQWCLVPTVSAAGNQLFLPLVAR